MRSILHDKKRHTCYLCYKLHDDDSWKNKLEEHHVFGGTSNRNNSEKYGLKVYLCGKHHVYGPEAVHMRPDINLRLKQEAQRFFEKSHTREEFVGIFGKNYL